MPSYYNPNNIYPASYLNPYGSNLYSQMQQPMAQSQQSFSPQGPRCAMMWISDEMEARGQQIPQGFTQLAMWDTNNPVIYLKSLNQMGMPNPMQVLHYTIDQAQGNLMPGQGNSGAAGGNAGNVSGNNQSGSVDMSQYVTKQDLEEIKKEMREALSGANHGGNNGANGNYSGNQNGSNNGQNGNRGGNR